MDFIEHLRKAVFGLSGDSRQSFRMLAKSPLISALIVLLLAFGIGLNTTVFSFLEATVTNPFPFRDSELLVDIVRGSHEPAGGPFNHAAFTLLQDNGEIFEDVAGYRDGGYEVVVSDGGSFVRGAAVSASLFRTLDVQPLLGRAFTANEEGLGGSPVAIISHYRWQSWFHGDRDVLGETIIVDGVERTIVGVMPRGFKFYEADAVWIPLPVDAATPRNDNYYFSVVGRLSPEVSVAQASSVIGALDEEIRPIIASGDEYDATRMNFDLRPAPIWEGLMIPGRMAVAMLLQIIAGMVLVVVGANLASLMFARGLARRRDVAVRRALGAPSSRLIRQIVVENLMLALAGGVAGCMLAVWGHQFFAAVLPLLPGASMRLDLRILTFAIGISTLAMLAFGSKPLLDLSRTPPDSVLKEWATGATAPRDARSWQKRLAVLQIALSFLLLLGASLVVRSAIAITNVEPGFDARGVFEVHLAPTGTQQYSFVVGDRARRVAEALAETPGVASVGWRNAASPEVIGTTSDLLRGAIETRDGPSQLATRDILRGGAAVSTGFLEAFGVSLRRGRLFDERDRRGTPFAAVISERAAEILWPEGEALGQQIRWSGGTTWVTVVGVVSDIARVSRGGGASPAMGLNASPDIYLAAEQFAGGPSTNVLWVRPDASVRDGFSQLVQELVPRVDVDLRTALVQTVWQGEYGRHRQEYGAAGQVLGSLGGIMLLLSLLGTYSVIAYSWVQREREIGLRMACGASPRDIFRLVQRDCRTLAVQGVMLGGMIAAAVYRLLASVLFEIGPWDPLSYLAIAGLLVTMVAFAGLGPTLSATHKDPSDALRRM